VLIVFLHSPMSVMAAPLLSPTYMRTLNKADGTLSIGIRRNYDST